MYARVARWEGGEAEGLRASGDEINSRANEGPPPGVPAKGFLMLIDPDSGRSLAISLYDTLIHYFDTPLVTGGPLPSVITPAGGKKPPAAWG